MSSDIGSWLDYATQQMAAESYLDGINLLSRNEVKDKLLLGNNHPLLDSSLSGKTRFTNVLAEEFLDRYQIVDHIKVLEDTSNNKVRAAKILGIDRRTLYRMAERFGIELGEEGESSS